MMNGIAGSHHPQPPQSSYGFHEAIGNNSNNSSSSQTSYYSNGTAAASSSTSRWPPYATPSSSSAPPQPALESEPGRRHLPNTLPSGPPPPLYNSAWNTPATSAPPRQDPSFSHPHNISPSHHSHAPLPPFNRPPPHIPLEPSTAPSPPTQYPSSPRGPLSNGIPSLSNGLRQGSAVSRPNLSIATPASSFDERASSQNSDRPAFAESCHPSPSTIANSPLPHSLQRRSIGHPLGPPTPVSYPSPLSAGGRIENSSQQHRGSVYTPTPIKREFTNGNGYGSGRSSVFEDDIKRRDSQPLPHRHSHGYDSLDDEKEIKQEDSSRAFDASVSPTSLRHRLEERTPSFSGGIHPKLEKSDSNGELGPRKRGKAVFRDHNGVEYFENEPVPDGVKVPDDWQLGTGKQTRGLLLPKQKDGIPVNPEWGFTAGGKARQRLPQACKNCRAKKIRCVESDYDESLCQHCMKMRIPCQRYEREDEKKKKPRGGSHSHDRKRSVVAESPRFASVSSPIESPNEKKRKSEDAGRRDVKKRRDSSRSGSIQHDPIDTEMANAGSSQMVAQATPNGTRSYIRGPMFPVTEDPAGRAHCVEAPRSPLSRKYALQMAREGHQNGHREGHQNGSQEHQQYGVKFEANSIASSPNTAYASSPTTSVSNMAVTTQSYNTDYSFVPHHRASTSEPTSISTPPPARFGTVSIPRNLGEDPRHPVLPGRDLLTHLVELYFDHVYSQTYAFLHRRTFMEDLDKQSGILLLSMCSVACRFSNFNHKEEERFADATRGEIMQKYDQYTIDVVQSLVHMGLHDFGSNNGQKAWMFAGMAVRMGAAMNLNLESGRRDKGKTAIEREVARRTYWAYYLMDRFNSYGVARPFLTQDHDCHIQLPCNQPSFARGEYVKTEHLLGPNPYHPSGGTEFMGAMAYLVRVVGIWGNILKQIHLSGFQTKAEREASNKDGENGEFNAFIDTLETWRKQLPPGLKYSNENLAGQIRVGTTGAFVVMHVMWHTAMAYVHRYVRTVGVNRQQYIQSTIPKTAVVESIRKAFVHSDAVLQIMYHVQQRKQEAEREIDHEPVFVNAPFLGQAIHDACNITVIRAMEVRGEPGGARDQRTRVEVGLKWLDELRKFWRPLNDIYRRLRSNVKKLDKGMSAPPPATPRREIQAYSPADPGALQPMNLPYPIDPNQYSAQPPLPDDASIDYSAQANCNFEGYTDIFFDNMQPMMNIYSDAFQGVPQVVLYDIATEENGFPHLYWQPNSYDNVEMGTATAASAPYQSPVSSDAYAISQSQHSMYNPTVSSEMPHMSPQVSAAAAAAASASASGNSSTHDDSTSATAAEDDIAEEDAAPNPASGPEDAETPNRAFTTYFHEGAVRNGNVGEEDQSSPPSDHSRRTSEAAPKTGENCNPMDVINLLVDVGEKFVGKKIQRDSDEFPGQPQQVLGALRDGGLVYDNAADPEPEKSTPGSTT